MTSNYSTSTLRNSVRVPGALWKALTGILMTATILAAFLWVGPVLNVNGQPYYTMGGHGAKLIFFHVPCSWLASLAYFVSAWYAGRYLVGLNKPHRMTDEFMDDYKSAAAMFLGTVFGALATVTGMIFAHNEWGAYWSWDPRQTSILIIELVFAAYVVLRGAVPQPDVRARLCSAYTLIAVVPGLFLIWVLPRIVGTLHSEANKVIVGRQISGNYRITMYALAFPAFTMLFVWLFQLTVRLMKLEERRALVG